MADSPGLHLAGRPGVRTWGIAFALACVAAVPRLVRPDLSEYKLDEATAVLNGWSIVQHHVLPLQGQGSSLAGASQGPFFYDLVALILAVGHDPRAVVVAIGLANSIAVGLSYLVFARAFNRRVGLIAALLFAGGSWPIVFSRKIWPNDLLAPLAVVALWGLLRALDPATKRPGLGRAWLAVALMGSLNLSAWPLALVPALVQVVVPRTRRGRALATSLVGLAALIAAAAVEARTLAVISVDLTAPAGHQLTFDLSPLTYIVQLVGTDAFQLLAGPVGSIESAASPIAWLDPLLRAGLLLGVAVALGRTALHWRQLQRPTFTPELLIVVWWVTPAVAALERPVPVAIHHFLATVPTQFVLVALGIDWLVGLAKRPWLARAAVGFAALAFLVQVRVFASLLAFVAAQPVGTFFGVPLGSSLVAARDARAAVARGPVFLLSQGDLVGVDNTPTVIASLAPGVPVHDLDAARTLLFPAEHSATYLIGPDSIDQLRAALRPWQANATLSAVSTLPGGYAQFEGGPFDGSLPHHWRKVGAVAADRSVVVGYAAPRQIQPGVPFEVDVLWRIGRPAADPRSESVFAHLVNDQGQNFVGEDFAPLPTTRWIPGVGVLNRFQLTAPSQIPPGRYWIDFGRYRRPGIQPVRFMSSDNVPGPASIRLGPLSVPPPTARPGQLVAAHALFGHQIRLDGWKVQRSPGEIAVDLLWGAVRAPVADYTVFVHLVAPSGKVVAQDDGQPRDGQFPTRTWRHGDRVLDPHGISLADVPPGDYQIVVGLYRLASGQRLPVDGHTAYRLGEIRVSDGSAG